MDPILLIVTANIVVWGAICLYVCYLGRCQKKIEAKLLRLASLEEE